MGRKMWKSFHMAASERGVEMHAVEPAQSCSVCYICMQDRTWKRQECVLTCPGVKLSVGAAIPPGPWLYL